MNEFKKLKKRKYSKENEENDFLVKISGQMTIFLLGRSIASFNLSALVCRTKLKRFRKFSRYFDEPILYQI